MKDSEYSFMVVSSGQERNEVQSLSDEIEFLKAELYNTRRIADFAQRDLKRTMIVGNPCLSCSSRCKRRGSDFGHTCHGIPRWRGITTANDMEDDD